MRRRYGTTAECAGCECIWSEDLNAGQKYFGVTVQNPFLNLVGREPTSRVV